MANALAAFLTIVLGLLLMPLLATLSGTVFYFLWNYLAPKYFTFMPAQYLALPWWHAVCLLWLLQLVSPFKVTTTK